MTLSRKSQVDDALEKAIPELEKEKDKVTDRVAADAAAAVGGSWIRETSSSRLHSGGNDNDEKEEVNSGA